MFYLSEKFLGRLAAWFEEHLAAINVQFVPQAEKRRKRKRRIRAVTGPGSAA